MKSILIIGGGKVGTYLTRRLIEHGYKVMLVEKRRERCAAILRVDCIDEQHLICGDAAEPSVLEQAGIKEADRVVVVTGWDETNLVVATLAKMEYGVEQVLARANNPKNSWLFTPVMGVDVAINTAELTARLLAESIQPHLDDELFGEQTVEPDRPVN